MPREKKLTHGASAWRTRRCTCDMCSDASRLLARKNYKERVDRLKQDPTLAPHGRYSTYINWGCRCELCRDAREEYYKDRESVE